MTETATFDVRPDYGWGWMDISTQAMIETPGPFQLLADIVQREGRFAAVGCVDSPTHILHRMWVVLVQRLTEWEGTCNVSVYEERPAGLASSTKSRYSGFATLAGPKTRPSLPVWIASLRSQ